MWKTLLFYVAVAVGAGFSGCTWIKSQPGVNEIIDQVKRQNDPQNKIHTVKTAVLKYNCRCKTEKMTITVLLKQPGKISIRYQMGKDFQKCAFDGRTAWEYSHSRGLRYLPESERNEIRLQAFLLAPAIDIKTVFKDIKLAGSVEINKQDCWKLICQPADIFQSQSITVFVSKHPVRIVRIIEQQDTEDKVIEVDTSFSSYLLFEGFLMPEKAVTKIGDELTESTLISVTLNREIPDSVFAAPEMFK
ncbi:MAG: hypothetical protein PHH77_03190 [Victivallaceae bacterium]|nr:hypothetical protein [Victivallaceae bacterium]